MMKKSELIKTQIERLEEQRDKREAEVAITNRGRITVTTFDLMTDETGALYFEYGCMYDRIYLNEFEEEAR